MTTLAMTDCTAPRDRFSAALVSVLLHGALAVALLSLLPAKVMLPRLEQGFELVMPVAAPPAQQPVAEAKPEPPATVAVSEPEPAPAPAIEEPQPEAIPEPKPKPKPVERAHIDPPRRSEAPPAKPRPEPVVNRAPETPAPVAGTVSGSAVPAAQETRESFAAPSANVAYLNNPRPSYPRSARRRHMEGTVVLFVAVGADGRPTQVKVRTSSGFDLLDRAALEAVTRWRFEPARRNGIATAGQVLVPVRFRLENG